MDKESIVDIDAIMTNDPTGEKLINFAKAKAIEIIKADITRHQLRKIFTEARRIETDWDTALKKDDSNVEIEKAMRKLAMLKPKIIYQEARSARGNNPPPTILSDIFGSAIDKILSAPIEERTPRFRRFMELSEAIVAYHRASGSKE